MEYCLRRKPEQVSLVIFSNQTHSHRGSSPSRAPKRHRFAKRTSWRVSLGSPRDTSVKIEQVRTVSLGRGRVLRRLPDTPDSALVVIPDCLILRYVLADLLESQDCAPSDIVLGAFHRPKAMCVSRPSSSLSLASFRC